MEKVIQRVQDFRDGLDQTKSDLLVVCNHLKDLMDTFYRTRDLLRRLEVYFVDIRVPDENEIDLLEAIQRELFG